MAYNNFRMDNQWLPFTPNRAFQKDPRVFVGADGMHFTTHDGRQVIDGISSLWCVGAGHNRQSINEAIKKQLDTLDYSTAFSVSNDKAFRAAAYDDAATLFCRITCDSRETVPLTLAFLRLSGGDVEKAILYAANFGRDADTTASMVGAIVGALHGADAIRPAWVTKIEQYTSRNQVELATALTETAIAKHRALAASQQAVEAILTAR